MKNWLNGLVIAVFFLSVFAACGKNTNPFNPALFKSSEAEYQTVTEETAPAMAMPGMMQPFLSPPPPPGPDIPPPLLDPLTNGPVLPPPPPPFDDEGAVPRPLVIIPRCGDRKLEQDTVVGTSTPQAASVRFPVSGEQCEDGNDFNGDGCSDICIEEYCGNGYVEPEHGEQCDGGVAADTFPLICGPNNPGCIASKKGLPQAWNCDKFCRLIVCGDGVVQLGGVAPAPTGQTVKVAEQCDLGAKNGGCSGCTTTCTLQKPCNATNPGCTCPTK